MKQLSTTQRANAKINLYLHVTGRRKDGFHTLDSLVVFADVGDNISASRVDENSDILFTTSGPFGQNIPLGENNLVVRAAKLLQGKYAITAGARINLEKNIPPASGIGGGSADAAATMRALAEIWEIDFTKENKSYFNQMISASLGADVPVCFNGKNVFMGGIGEILTPAPTLPQCWLVLANPGVAVSTPEVFAARKGTFSHTARFENVPLSVQELVDIVGLRKNDLTPSAQYIAPEIETVISLLHKLDDALLVRMSGSGATCFAIFPNEQSAITGAKKILKENPKWWVRAARMLI